MMTNIPSLRLVRQPAPRLGIGLSWVRPENTYNTYNIQQSSFGFGIKQGPGTDMLNTDFAATTY